NSQTRRCFADEVPILLASADPPMSIRQLAARCGVSSQHLVRVLNRSASKRVSGDLAKRVAEALGLPRDYFPEYRESIVLQAVRSDPALTDRLYNLVTDRGSKATNEQRPRRPQQ